MFLPPLSPLRLPCTELHNPLRPGFSYVDGAVQSDRDVVDGVEHRIAGLPEADRRDNIPLPVELEDARVFGIVIGAANSDVERALGIGGYAKGPTCRIRVFGASPLPLELACAVEQLQARVFAVGDEHVRTAGHEYQPMGITEFTLAGPLLTPFLQPFAVAVEKSADVSTCLDGVLTTDNTDSTDRRVGGVVCVCG